DAEAERAGRDVADAPVSGHKGLELSAANGPVAGRADEHQERQRDLDSERRRTVERQTEAERAPRSALATQEDLGRSSRRAGQDRRRRRARSEREPQRSHDASSTIQATSSRNDKPA